MAVPGFIKSPALRADLAIPHTERSSLRSCMAWIEEWKTLAQNWREMARSGSIVDKTMCEEQAKLCEARADAIQARIDDQSSGGVGERLQAVTTKGLPDIAVQRAAVREVLR